MREGKAQRKFVFSENGKNSEERFPRWLETRIVFFFLLKEIRNKNITHDT